LKHCFIVCVLVLCGCVSAVKHAVTSSTVAANKSQLEELNRQLEKVAAPITLPQKPGQTEPQVVTPDITKYDTTGDNNLTWEDFDQNKDKFLDSKELGVAAKAVAELWWFKSKATIEARIGGGADPVAVVKDELVDFLKTAKGFGSLAVILAFLSMLWHKLVTPKVVKRAAHDLADRMIARAKGNGDGTNK